MAKIIQHDLLNLKYIRGNMDRNWMIQKSMQSIKQCILVQDLSVHPHIFTSLGCPQGGMNSWLDWRIANQDWMHFPTGTVAILGFKLPNPINAFIIKCWMRKSCRNCMENKTSWTSRKIFYILDGAWMSFLYKSNNTKIITVRMKGWETFKICTHHVPGNALQGISD